MSGKALQVNTFNFEQVALRKDSVPVLIDFWAPWCAPCRMIAPVLDELANELEGKAVIAKVNVDEEPLLANAVRIRAVPTMLLFRNGKLQDVIMGVQSKQQLKRKLLV